MVDIHIKSHANGIGGNKIINLSFLIERCLCIAGARGQSAKYNRRAPSLPPDQLGNRVNRVSGKSDDRTSARQARDFFGAGECQFGKTIAGFKGNIGKELAQNWRHGIRSQQ